MTRILPALLCVFLFPVVGCADEPKPSKAEPIAVAPTDWAWWRGPDRTGIAPKQNPPLKWSATENVLWKSPVPGRGHGSPSVVGDRIFLATADHDNETQSVLCFDRTTGKPLWETVVHRGGFVKGNVKSSLASCTIACDGKRVFVNFLNAGAITTTALDLDGKQVWQTKISDYVLHQGFGSSPALYGSLVIVSADNKGGGLIAALDRATGKLVWSHERPKFPNYVSPIILKADGRDQLFLSGCELVTSLDPLTGKKIWETKGSTTECVTSAVTDGKVVFTSGGYPKNHVAAVATDGSGKVVWENKTRVYVPSMVVREDHLYAVLDEGVAMCWRCDTGKELWKERLDGTFSASPVFVGDTVFATNEAGKTFVFKATPEGFTPISVNKLGDDAFATPTICGDRIYMRVASQVNGKRQEMLYCIGKKE
ncbi:MAG: PQQ-binding-like beta-propeller repeat protein [Planctomycetes bacterium]|nr:PQQ-binding-like beta-propeller repeat protein [Planctomycetota bacterium]